MRTEEAVEVFLEVEKLRKEVWDHIDSLKLLQNELNQVKETLNEIKNKKNFLFKIFTLFKNAKPN